ncbi:hypothetical protein LA345_12865 [Burkholderia vietnamiensis]|uniref:Uncharacterized protein n=1 Tax=Burkholderia vietnamiensis (strain G4 / LMG 22486) TaxID=269482 RepID=A4JFJ0_BURVG|nr:hypothetical protein Bcep1808_2041 [Burkholderia vietnamiensis G4]MCB4344803.1 hypothetical protein [Burkholderia vietnamiensis]
MSDTLSPLAPSIDPVVDAALTPLRPLAAQAVERARRLSMGVKTGSLFDAADGASESSSSELAREGRQLLTELAELREVAEERSLGEHAVELALMRPEVDGPDAMTPAAARAFSEQGARASDAAAKIMQAVSADPHDGLALKELRESAKWRRIVTGGARERDEESERVALLQERESGDALDPLGDFAPLLQWLSAEASPSLLAELTARMELYVRSGHALRDCVEDDGLSQTPAATAMRALHESWANAPQAAADAGRDIPGLGVAGMVAEVQHHDRAGALSVIAARFAELFEPFRVERIEQPSGEADWIARALPRDQGDPNTMLRRAGSGEVDGVLRDARDPSILHVAVATADESTFIENNQASRHHRAILNAVASGAISGVREVRPVFCAPSLLYKKADGRELRGDFLGSIWPPATDQEREAINALPFFSMSARMARGHGTLDVADLSCFDLCLMGADADNLNRQLGHVRSIADGADRRKAFLTLESRTLAAVVDVVARKDPATPLMRSSGVNLPMFGSFCEALEALTRHAVDCPDVMEPLQAREGSLRRMRLQITGDSAIAGRLDDLSAKLEIYPELAKRQLRREQEESAEREAILAAAGQRRTAAAPARAAQIPQASAPQPKQTASEASAQTLADATTPQRSASEAALIEPPVEAAQPRKAPTATQLRAARREQIVYRNGRFDATEQTVEELFDQAGERGEPSAERVDAARSKLEASRKAMGETLTLGDRAFLDWAFGEGLSRILAKSLDRQLVQAAGEGDAMSVGRLLDRGVSPFATHDDVTALDAAEAGRHYEVLDLLHDAALADTLAMRVARERARALSDSLAVADLPRVLAASEASTPSVSEQPALSATEPQMPRVPTQASVTAGTPAASTQSEPTPADEPEHAMPAPGVPPRPRRMGAGVRP